MVADYKDNMRFYEQARMAQYRDAKIGYHSNEDIREAYYNWSTAVPSKRTLEWEQYCDVRDGFELGTNTALRRRHEESSKRDYAESRYVSNLK